MEKNSPYTYSYNVSKRIEDITEDTDVNSLSISKGLASSIHAGRGKPEVVDTKDTWKATFEEMLDKVMSAFKSNFTDAEIKEMAPKEYKQNTDESYLQEFADLRKEAQEERETYMSTTPIEDRVFEEEESITSAGIMSKPLTAEERTTLSEVGEITKSQGLPTTDQSGVFSNTKLEKAISGSVTNPLRQSILKGAIEIETGGAAPGMEGMGYRLGTKSPPTGAYKSYDDAVVDQALASLTTQQQARANTNVPMNALGQAIMDISYDDGGTGRGGSFYRGGGLIQITGHNNYQEVQNILARKGINVDLIANPELVNDTRYALPAALAFLEYAGLTDTVAEDMSAKRLNNMINRGAGREKAERRWGSVISSLRAAGETAKADELELRNEYAAQRRIGFTGATNDTEVDGIIGPKSIEVMREYLTGEGVTIPENPTDDELVILVNKN